MKTTRVFDKTSKAWLDEPRYISSCGGTRSGKTFSILQLLFIFLVGIDTRGETPVVVSVVSESLPHLKRGAIRDFKTMLQAEGVWDEARWNETDKIYTFANGSILEFFGVDNAGKVYGASRDYLFINEAQHIEWETFRQLAIRTRVRIIFDYNPTHTFWANDKIEVREDCICIHSTYKDNNFLTEEQVREIESNKADANWWRVFGEGQTGQLEGVIYDFQVIDRLPADASSLVEVYGLDFGYTADPTALLRVLCDTRRKVAYVDELLYRTGMRNSEIAAVMRSEGIPLRSVEVFADSAEPKSIAELASYGWNVKPCYKGADRAAQLSFVSGWKINVTKRSVDTLREGRSYTWAQDKDGRRLNVPISFNDHAMDALRYAIFTKFGQFRRPTHGGTPRQRPAWENM